MCVCACDVIKVSGKTANGCELVMLHCDPPVLQQPNSHVLSDPPKPSSVIDTVYRAGLL